jgi:predicted PurR-regulated permease PerM
VSHRRFETGVTGEECSVSSDRSDVTAANSASTTGAGFGGTTDWAVVVRLVLIILVVVAGAQMFSRLEAVIGLVLMAAALAAITSPVTRRLSTRIGRGGAIGVTAIVTLVVAAVIGVMLFRDLAAQLDRLSGELVDRIDSLEPGSLPERLATASGIERALDSTLDSTAPVVLTGADDVAGVGRRIFDTFFVVILAAFFQSGAPAALDWLASRWQRERRGDVRRLVADIERRGVGYARRSLMLAGGVALAVGLTCVAVDMPGRVVLATWAGVWSLVPFIGWAIGLLPLLVAGSIAGPVEFAALGAVSVAVVVVGTWRRRRLEARTIRLGLTPAALAIALGASVGGVGGAVVAFVAISMLAAAFSSSEERPPVAEAELIDMSAVERAPAIVPATSSHDAEAVPVSHRPATALLRTSGAGVVVAPGWRGVLAVGLATLGGLLLWMLGSKVGPAAIWVLIAVLVSVALDRPISWLMRRLHVPRGAAVAVVVLIGTAVVVGVAWVGAAGTGETSTEFTRSLPQVVEDLETAPLIGGWLEDRDAAVWLDEQMNDLPQRVSATTDVAEWLPTAGARVLDLFWVALLIVVFMVDGGRVVHAVERQVPARHRRQVQRLTGVSYRALAGYAGGAALLATINATVVLTVALALGIALAPVLAVWAFIWNFVPQIGGFMGGVPLVLFALAAGPLRALAAGLIFLMYQLVENHVLQPTIIGDAIDVPPWVTLLAAVVGATAAGVVGAMVLTPMVGVLRMMHREIGRDDFPGRTVAAHAGDGSAVEALDQA